MSKSKEIRLLNDRLDYYTMEAEDDQVHNFCCIIKNTKADEQPL